MAKLYGCEEPRIFTPPLRELTPETTIGYEVIDFAENVLEIKLLPWQKWLFVHALEIIDKPDGWMLRFRTVLVLIGRQNGKTTMGAILSLFFLYVLRTGLVLGTAQDLEQAEDTWSMCVDMAQQDPELSEQISHVWYTNGAKRLQLTGNRDYRVKASTRKAGRGKSADLVLLDELREHQTWEAYSALSKTGIAKESALLWCMSNAGDGTSVVLRHLRVQAHKMLGDPDGIAGETSDDIEDTALGIFEWSADPKMQVTSTDAWRQANPSLGYTITERAIRSACADDPEDVFKTECLCQWVTASVVPPFPVGAWENGIDKESEADENAPLYFGVDVSDSRNKASIAVCGRRVDNSWHVELVEYRAGAGWLQQWFAQRVQKYGGMKVALQAKGAPVSSFAEIIGAVDGVEVVPCQGADVAGWCGRLWDAVAACDGESDAMPVYHRPQPALDLAANIAATRPLGDGAWAWDRKKSLEDISPLVAVTMALGAATSVTKKQRYESVYESRGVLVV